MHVQTHTHAHKKNKKKLKYNTSLQWCGNTYTQSESVPAASGRAGSGGVLTTGVTEQICWLAGPASLYERAEIRPSALKQEIGCIFPSKTCWSGGLLKPLMRVCQWVREWARCQGAWRVPLRPISLSRKLLGDEFGHLINLWRMTLWLSQNCDE